MIQRIYKNNILLTNILAKNLENHIQKAGAILEVTSKLPQVRNMSYAHLLNQTLRTLHGIPQYADKEKRQVLYSLSFSFVLTIANMERVVFTIILFCPVISNQGFVYIIQA